MLEGAAAGVAAGATGAHAAGEVVVAGVAGLVLPPSKSFSILLNISEPLLSAPIPKRVPTPQKNPSLEKSLYTPYIIAAPIPS